MKQYGDYVAISDYFPETHDAALDLLRDELLQVINIKGFDPAKVDWSMTVQYIDEKAIRGMAYFAYKDGHISKKEYEKMIFDPQPYYTLGVKITVH